MKNVIKKVASIAMALTLLGTGTSVTNIISPGANDTIAAGYSSQIRDYKACRNAVKQGNAVCQGAGMYNNTFYYITEEGNSNCKLYKKGIDSKEETITLSRPELIGHGNDLCVAKCDGKICLFIVDGQKRNNILLKYELDREQKNAKFVAQYQFKKSISAVTLVNADGNAPLEFIFRGGKEGKEIYTVEIERNQKSCKDIEVNFIGKIKTVSGADKSQGICYFNHLLIVPYTNNNNHDNYIQIYGIHEDWIRLEKDGKPLDSCKVIWNKNTDFEIEGIDYSNGNRWYFNTNEKNNYGFYYSDMLIDKCNYWAEYIGNIRKKEIEKRREKEMKVRNKR